MTQSAMARMDAARVALTDALARFDAADIEIASGALADATAALAAPGAWHADAAIADDLAGLMAGIELARVRVNFMADHARRRVDELTLAGANVPVQRPRMR